MLKSKVSFCTFFNTKVISSLNPLTSPHLLFWPPFDCPLVFLLLPSMLIRPLCSRSLELKHKSVTVTRQFSPPSPCDI